MSNIKLLFTGCIAALLVSSCGMMNDGFSGSSIQKRKYTKGFYFSKNKSWSKEVGEKSTELKADQTILSEDQKTVAEEKQSSVKPVETVANSEVLIQQPAPADKKNEQTSEKTGQKKEPEKKSGTVERKNTNNGSSATSRSRKERVPERYIPMKQEAIKNKMDRHMSHSMADDFQILCVILTILIPFVGVAVYTNLDVTKTLICLLLTLLFYIPGLIYGLLVVFDKI